MDSQDQRSAVKRLVDVLRGITRFVQFLPFAYLLLYAVLLLTEPFLTDGFMARVSALTYVPPSAVAVLLVLSKSLKLCAWHKTACVFPLSSRVTDFIDNYMLQFTQNEIILINAILGMLALCFIIETYRHFFHGRKKHTV